MSSPRRWPAWLPWILGALIPILLGIWVRLYPLTHHVTSDAYDKSTLLVLNRVRMAVTAQVERQYPQLPPEQRERIIQNLFQEMVRKDNAKIRKAFDILGQNMAQADGKDKHYLLASDSYYYLDLTERILTDGSPGKIKGSQYFNDRMLAPVGYWEPQTWHPYIGAWVHRVVSRFSPGTDLMTNVGFTPLILFPLVIAAFLLGCWACGHHWFPGSIAATFMAMAPIYLKRSSYGWYDNDTYSILFPLLGMAWMIAAVGRRDRKTAGIFLTLCALTLALYTQFWYGWWFILGIMIIGLLAIGIIRKVLGHPQWRSPLFITGGLLLILGAFLLLFYGPRHSIDILLFAWGELNKFIMPKLRDWPDLFIMVGELHNGSLLETIRQSGGWIFFIGGLWPLVWAFRDLLRKEPPSDRLVLLGTFLLVTFILSLGAQRFSLLCLPALGLLFSETIQGLWAQRALWAERFKTPPRTATVLIISGSLILTAFSVAHGRVSVAKNLNTIFNSAWDRALSRIEQETPTESVINAWWAPGHFIKAIAKRGVLFDGASIRGDIAYWLTQAYLSPDEDKAVDILRMLNTGSNRAAEYLLGKGFPLSRIVATLKQGVHEGPQEARDLYTKLFSAEDAGTILPWTHGHPRPAYLLLYQENVENMMVLAYTGKWDFLKIEALNRDPALRNRVPSKGSKAYVDFLWNIAGGPFRQSDPLRLLSSASGKLVFEEGVSVDLAARTVRVDSPRFGRGTPAALLFRENDHLIDVPQKGATLKYAVILFEQDGTLRCMLMDEILARSLLVRLYFFEGIGLKRFRPFIQERDLSGRTRILVYQILW